ncbi:thioredoxin family protein [Chitinophaga agri]|uniref:Thioredoxin fold domain-containing protein n=1 Tax=Chitinophaga agri TaxID=2703787 RepID=A0A6B9Z7X6_9BACT|nr:thioredoxin fold domain-containing protein [Chitinophaga agri]QHS58330.1 thioredoxin fold domain-containing protein [Chitinophaga agri]
MKKIVIVLLAGLTSPMLSLAQTPADLFEKLPNWQSVLEKAAKANKNIFIDFYATWCAPCQEMDASVYTAPTVRDYLSEHFLPVKIQMDQTKNDNPEVQAWYKDAVLLGKQYHVDAFPSFLFLSPKGDLLTMQFGFHNAADFLKVLEKANDLNNAYYPLLKQYQDGKLPDSALLNLAIRTKELKADSLARVLVSKYKNLYFDKLRIESQLTKNFTDLAFHFPTTIHESDKVVRYIYNHPQILDSAFRPGISKEYTSFFISRDYIMPLITAAEKRGKEPDWKDIEYKVTKRYDSKTGKRLAFDHKLAWYYKQEDWENVVKYEIEKVEEKGIENAVKASTLQVNNLVYEVIFKRSMNPAHLKKGLQFIEVIMKNNPHDDEVIDTYANVLYKIGRKEEAIQQEKRALSLAEEKKRDANAKIYKEVIQKMENNVPTWQ